MSTQEQKRYFPQGMMKAHKALGAGMGVLLFIVCFSGAIALFEREMQTWQSVKMSSTNAAPSDNGEDWPLNKITAEVMKRYAGEKQNDVEVLIIGKATPDQKFLSTYTHTESDEAWHEDAWHGVTGQHLAKQEEGVGHLLTEVHTDLWLPSPYGRYLVGFMGIVLMLMAIGGIYIHRNWRQEFNAVRVDRGKRRQWADLHKLLGLWALPFHLMIGFTGALIGLLGLLLILIALVAYKGDQQAAIDEIFGQDPKISHQPMVIPDINHFVAKAKQDMQPGFKTTRVTLMYPGDKNMFILVGGSYHQTLSNIDAAKYLVSTGEIIKLQDYVHDKLVLRLYSATIPLHYATFGGIAMKLLYFILALGTCMLPLSGLYLWLKRRKQLDWKTSFTLFGLTGLPLAGSFAFVAAASVKWMAALQIYSAGEGTMAMTAYSFIAGLLFSLIFSLRLQNLSSSLSTLLFWTWLPLLIVAVLDSILQVFIAPGFWAGEAWGVNLGLLFVAAVGFALYRYVQRDESADKDHGVEPLALAE